MSKWDIQHRLREWADKYKGKFDMGPFASFVWCLRLVVVGGCCPSLLTIVIWKIVFGIPNKKSGCWTPYFFFAKVPMIVGHSISNVVEKIEKTIYPRHIHQFSLLLGFASSLSFWVKGHSFLAESGYPSLRSMPGIGCHMGNPRLHPFADNC